MNTRWYKLIMGLMFILMGIVFIYFYQATNSYNKKKAPEIIADKGIIENVNLKEFKEDLVSGTKGDKWSIQPIPNSEIVKGMKGKYFVIDINNADADETIYFNAGKYIIDDFDKKFTLGLTNFGKQVLNKIKGKVNYKTFVKGSADLAGDDYFLGTLIPPYMYTSISCFAALSSTQSKSKFSTSEITKSIPNKFNNSHLPDLRARFIQEGFYEIYDHIVPKPIILEGNISLKIDDKDRNATLLLYLPESFFSPVEN